MSNAQFYRVSMHQNDTTRIVQPPVETNRRLYFSAPWNVECKLVYPICYKQVVACAEPKAEANLSYDKFIVKNNLTYDKWYYTMTMR